MLSGSALRKVKSAFCSSRAQLHVESARASRLQGMTKRDIM
jgi:hypothetical protein